MNSPQKIIHNLIIVGTGPSSLASALVAISKGYKPLIVSDVDYKMNIKKNNYLFNNHIFGGLSNYWGGAICKITSKEQKKFFFKENLNKYYNFVDTFLHQIGANDDYAKFYNLNKKIKKINQYKINFSKKKNIKIGSSRLAIKNNKSFSTKKIFLNLVKNKKISIIKKFKIDKIFNEKEKITIFADKKKLFCKKLFLGAGPYNTGKILINNFKFLKEIKIKENKLNILFVILKKKIFYKNNHHFSDFFVTKIGANAYHNQIYFLKDKLLNRIKKNNFLIFLILKILNFFLKNKVLLIFNYMPSNKSDFLILKKNSKIKIKKNKLNSNKYFNILKDDTLNIFKNYNPLLLIKFKTKFGYGNHCGNCLPISKKKQKFKSDYLGRIGNKKNFFIIDSSTLPILPTNTLTYTLMAHSARITNLALKKTYE